MLKNNYLFESIRRTQILLSDFKDFPQTAILVELRNNIRGVSTGIRRVVDSQELFRLLDEMIFIISAAIEKEIEIDKYILSTIQCVFNSFLVCFRDDKDYQNKDVIAFFAKYYLDILSPITSQISLLTKTKYLRFLELNIPKITKRYTEDDFLQKLKTELKVQTKKIDAAILHIEKKEVINNKINTINKQNNIDTNIKVQSKYDSEAQKIIQLFFLLENITSSAINNSINLRPEELKTLTSGNEVLKTFIDGKHNKLFDSFDTNIKKIDTYVNKLELFTGDDTYTIDEKSEIKTKQITSKQLNQISAIAININQLLNYNDIYYQNMSVISNNINKLYLIINSLGYSNISDKNYSNKLIINNISNILEDSLDKIEKTKKVIQNKFLTANSLSKKLFDEITKIRSKKFGHFTVGLEKYVNFLLDNFKRKITLNIKGEDVLINSNLWEVLDTVLGMVLRYIIVSKFKSKKEKQKKHNSESDKIEIQVVNYSGVVKIIFRDNGKNIEETKQLEELKEVIDLIEKFGGKIKITSVEGQNTIELKFHEDNSLQTYIIFTSNEGVYYAAPIAFCEILNSDADADSMRSIAANITNDNITISIKNIGADTNETNISNTNLSKNGLNTSAENTYIQQIIKITFNNKSINLVCDDIIAKAELTYQPFDNLTINSPYILACTQFGDKTVLILDIEELLNDL